jgi:GH15 family glucan-1,4-alpha-glucosidase
MPLVFFMSPIDPKMTRTLDALTQPLARGGLLSDEMIYRYNRNETVCATEGPLRNGRAEAFPIRASD